jgi:hypothetical protein
MTWKILTSFLYSFWKGKKIENHYTENLEICEFAFEKLRAMYEIRYRFTI